MEITQQNVKARTTPKDFFLHLGSLVFLYISVISILILLFNIIDEVFPKPLAYADPYSSGVSTAMAMLVVAFPLSLFFFHLVFKGEMAAPEKREIWIRKAFMYCTLFVVIVAVAIDLIVLLSSFFGGEEITIGFILKVIAIIFILGIVASYYLYDLHRKDGDDGSRVRTKYGWGAGALVVVSMTLGFLVMGSPYTQKEKRFDTERVNNLQSIQYTIVNYWQAKGKLPVTLDELKDPLYGAIVSLDPKSQTPYEYKATGKLSFQLCATFGREASGRNILSAPQPMMYKGGIADEGWQHAAGRVCFDRTIDPELHPPRKDLIMPVPVMAQ